jgi:hypothetical protein
LGSDETGFQANGGNVSMVLTRASMKSCIDAMVMKVRRPHCARPQSNPRAIMQSCISAMVMKVELLED